MVTRAPMGPPLPRSWYSASIATFLNSSDSEILWTLASNAGYALLDDQRRAWQTEIEILKHALPGVSGNILFEFTVPRIGSRIDVVVLLPTVVMVLEFKVGATKFDRAAQEQVWDYALDLKNFHEASHNAAILPVLIATRAHPRSASFDLRRAVDNVYEPLRIVPASLRDVLCSVPLISGPEIKADEWAHSPYRPTPTIIEAARALYAQHSVDDIARHDAGAQNLNETTDYIRGVIDSARKLNRKAICIVTGVPGAGKTLVGLNLATSRDIGQLASSSAGDSGNEQNATPHAVFLSGNGPLVAVLREALTRDEVVRRRTKAGRVRKADISRSVHSFIQNVHHFRDACLQDLAAPPSEHVVIFDEAQRAWTLEMTRAFMKSKKKLLDFNQSEPDFLISCMDRHQDWAVIVCLVGAGQEIRSGLKNVNS